MEFVLGQRWISQTETELGLGIVVDVEGRNVTLRFPVAEEDRVYARANSPLARVVYHPGDALHDQAQNLLTVVGVAVGVASTLLFKVAPILLVGWVVLKLIERKKDRNYLSDADRRWLEGE